MSSQMGVQITLISPDKVNFEEFEGSMRTALENTADYCKRAFYNTIGHWEHEVEFKSEIVTGSGEYLNQSGALRVYTEDEIWHYVDQGTEGPYAIQPRELLNSQGNLTALRFQPGYNAATRPGKLASHGYERYGSTQYAPTVIHPGIEPRHFTQIVTERALKRLQEELKKHLQDGLERSLHPLV